MPMTRTTRTPERRIVRSIWLTAALLAFTAGVAGVAVAQDAQDNLIVDNWDDAAKHLRCEAVVKNSDGSWTVRGALVVNGEKISRITGEHAADLAKRCPSPCPKTLEATGSGC
jgi:hypothetical protein